MIGFWGRFPDFGQFFKCHEIHNYDTEKCLFLADIKIYIKDLRNTAVDVFIKISEDLVLEYNLDMFKRWRLYPIVVVDGFPFRGSPIAIGEASDEWMDDYFNDESYENLDSYA